MRLILRSFLRTLKQHRSSDYGAVTRRFINRQIEAGECYQFDQNPLTFENENFYGLEGGEKIRILEILVDAILSECAPLQKWINQQYSLGEYNPLDLRPVGIDRNGNQYYAFDDIDRLYMNVKTVNGGYRWDLSAVTIETMEALANRLSDHHPQESILKTFITLIFIPKCEKRAKHAARSKRFLKGLIEGQPILTESRLRGSTAVRSKNYGEDTLESEATEDDADDVTEIQEEKTDNVNDVQVTSENETLKSVAEIDDSMDVQDLVEPVIMDQERPEASVNPLDEDTAMNEDPISMYMKDDSSENEAEARHQPEDRPSASLEQLPSLEKQSEPPLNPLTVPTKAVDAPPASDMAPPASEKAPVKAPAKSLKHQVELMKASGATKLVQESDEGLTNISASEGDSEILLAGSVKSYTTHSSVSIPENYNFEAYFGPKVAAAAEAEDIVRELESPPRKRRKGDSPERKRLTKKLRSSSSASSASFQELKPSQVSTHGKNTRSRRSSAKQDTITFRKFDENDFPTATSIPTSHLKNPPIFVDLTDLNRSK